MALYRENQRPKSGPSNREVGADERVSIIVESQVHVLALL
jgi:hypothetical protein